MAKGVVTIPLSFFHIFVYVPWFFNHHIFRCLFLKYSFECHLAVTPGGHEEGVVLESTSNLNCKNVNYCTTKTVNIGSN